MLLDELRQESDDICSRYRLRRLAIFGSVARREERTGSDLDVAVEFDGDDILFDRYMDLKHELETRFLRSVDLVTLPSVRNHIFRTVLEREMVALRG